MFALQRQIFSREDRIYASLAVRRPQRRRETLPHTRIDFLQRKNKQTILCLTVKEGNPWLHKVKSSGTDAFSLRDSWPLSAVSQISTSNEDGGTSLDRSSGEGDGAFTMTLSGKDETWIAVSADEMSEFLYTLWELASRYLPKQPVFVNFSLADVGRVRSPPNQSHNDSPGITRQATQDDEIAGDQVLSAEEEENVINLISSQAWDAGTAQNTVSRLQRELEALESANIHTLLTSEQETQQIVSQLDDALDALSALEKQIDEFDGVLEPVRHDARRVMEQRRLLDVQRVNYDKFVDELEALAGFLDFDAESEMLLETADFSDPELLASAAEALHHKLQQSLQPGWEALTSVQEHVDHWNRLQATLLNKAVRHIQRVMEAQTKDRADQVSSGGGGAILVASDHSSRHSRLLPFAKLVAWIRRLEGSGLLSQYTSLRKNYAELTAPLYKSELQAAFRHFKAAVASKPRKKGDEAKFLRRKAYFETFERILSLVESTVLLEQDFCIRFFNLDESGEQQRALPGSMSDEDGHTMLDGAPSSEHIASTENIANAAGLDRSPEAAESTESLPSRARPTSPLAVSSLSALFGDVSALLQDFLEEAAKADLFNATTFLVALDNHITNMTSNCPFLRSVFVSCADVAKQLHTKFLHTQERQFRDTKKDARQVVASFATLVKQLEDIAGRFEQRQYLDKVYEALLESLFDAIERIASESRHPGIVRFENFYRLHDECSRLRVDSLRKEFRPRVKERYQKYLKLFAHSVMGQPLERLSAFFEGIESLLAEGTDPASVSFKHEYSKQKLREVIQMYPGKVAQKKLDSTYQDVKRLISEDNLLAVVWRSVQEEFVNMIKRMQELIEKCYPDSGIQLAFSVDEVFEFFTTIAKSS